ncbi:MAG TPA: thiamine pyrophosphate-binding protein [Yaniella sp.]
MRTGGDLVIETLTALGAQTVFGIPGQHALGIFDALGRSELEFVSSRVENNAAFAADGYARTTGQPGVVVVSTGPGALTALAGLHEAYASSVPMIVISSQIPEAGLGGRRKGMLHELDDQQASARNVSKTQTLVRKASAIPYALEDAWTAALTAPQGPAWVEIPEDVLLGTASVPPPGTLELHIPQLRPHPGSVQRAVEILAAAQQPAIIAGGGIRRSGELAQTRLLKLAELLDAPVVCTPGGNSAFPIKHPLSLGSWVEDRHVTDLLNDADVLLTVGTSLGEVTSNYYTLTPAGQLIQIDAHQGVLESNYSGLGIRADAGLALDAITATLKATHPSPLPRTRSAAPQVATVRQRITERLATQNLQHEQDLLAAIRAGVPDDAHTFWDMTIAAYWAWNTWDAREGQFHSAQGAGGIGYAFPAALGGAVGAGERVLAVSGDGSAMYSIAELAAAKQHNIPVTWLIIDDGGYGILREYMTQAYGHTVATELSRPDFCSLAESFGIPATTASPAELTQALRTAWQGTGPSVVVCETTLRMWQPTHI